MVKNNVQNWLETFDIYPTKPVTCESNGNYFLGHIKDPLFHVGSVIGKTRTYKTRQYIRFDTPEYGFESGPENWSFVGFPTTGKYTNLKYTLINKYFTQLFPQYHLHKQRYTTK